MHDAEKALRDQNTPDFLEVIYLGANRTIYFNRDTDNFTINIPSSSEFRMPFRNWNNITKVFDADNLTRKQRTANLEQKKKKLSLKYFENAHNAEFTNSFIEACLRADIRKSPLENGLTTGSEIDGKLVSIDAIRKEAGEIVDDFLNAFKKRKVYRSKQFYMHNYYCSLYVEVEEKCLSVGVFIKSSKNSDKHYRFLLINGRYFIGHSVEKVGFR